LIAKHEILKTRILNIQFSVVFQPRTLPARASQWQAGLNREPLNL